MSTLPDQPLPPDTPPAAVPGLAPVSAQEAQGMVAAMVAEFVADAAQAAPLPLGPILGGQSVLVLGLGLSGLAMARWCAAEGAQVTVADTRQDPPQLAALRDELPQAHFVCGDFTSALLEAGIQAVFVSPGLVPSQTDALLQAARTQGLRVGGELALFT